MLKHEVKIRVRYSETDRMGYAYYGNFAAYFEVARVEMLRKYGVIYKELEDDGIILPVLDYSIKFFKPAFYDEELTISVTVPEKPGVRMRFEYRTINATGELLNEASTTLVFVSKDTGRPMPIPEGLLERFIWAYS